MVYIFRKISDLAGTPTSSQAGEVVAGQGQTKEGAYESTFRSPAKVYAANVGQDQGQLETGVNKNIAQTQADANKSSQEYQSKIQDVDRTYNYGGKQDLQNISNPETFSRLSSLVSPVEAQSQLSSIQSNTRNYNPDTSGVAASSDMAGLSAQLKNQYGTSEGGSRLDALLYRGSGQAGKAIQKGLGQINQFKESQAKQLKQESDLLNQLNQNAINRASQLKTEGSAYQNELQTNAAEAARQAQNKYDTIRNQDLINLQNQIKNTNYRAALEEAINNSFLDPSRRIGIQVAARNQVGAWDPTTIQQKLQDRGISPEQAALLAQTATQDTGTTTFGRTGEDQWSGLANVDLTDYTKQQLLDKFANQIDLNQFNPTNYLGEARTFGAEAYLDPRYNLIGQLLGTNQIAPGVNPSDLYTSNAANLSTDINKYLGTQSQAVTDAINQLFVGSSGQNNTYNPLNALVKDVVSNPYLSQATLAGPMAGMNIWTPGGRRVQDIYNTNLGGIYGNIEDVLGSAGSWFGF